MPLKYSRGYGALRGIGILRDEAVFLARFIYYFLPSLGGGYPIVPRPVCFVQTASPCLLGTAEANPTNLAGIVPYLKARVRSRKHHTVGIGGGGLNDFDNRVTQQLVLASSDLLQ